MDPWQAQQARNADDLRREMENQRRAELGRAAAALALEQEQRAREAAAYAASARREAERQANRAQGFRSW